MSDSKIKVVICPYKDSYVRPLSVALSIADVEVVTFGNWGMNLVNETDQLISLMPDIIHFHWPESLCDGRVANKDEVISNLRSSLRRLKEKNIKLVWTMHNLLPHDTKSIPFDKELYQLFADSADGCIHHSQCGLKEAIKTYQYVPETEHIVIKHGCHINKVKLEVSRFEARQELGLSSDANIYVTVGAIRPYKKIELLIETLVRRDGNEILLIAGGVSDKEYAQQLIDMEGVSKHVKFLNYVESSDMPKVIRASDYLVVAHGQSELTSAAPHFSQQYLIPLICPDAPYYREVLGGSALYYESDNSSNGFNDCLEKSGNADTRAMIKSLETNRHDYAWKKAGEETRFFYTKLLS